MQLSLFSQLVEVWVRKIFIPSIVNHCHRNNKCIVAQEGSSMMNSQFSVAGPTRRLLRHMDRSLWNLTFKRFSVWRRRNFCLLFLDGSRSRHLHDWLWTYTLPKWRKSHAGSERRAVPSQSALRRRPRRFSGKSSTYQLQITRGTLFGIGYLHTQYSHGTPPAPFHPEPRNLSFANRYFKIYIFFFVYFT